MSESFGLVSVRKLIFSFKVGQVGLYTAVPDEESGTDLINYHSLPPLTFMSTQWSRVARMLISKALVRVDSSINGVFFLPMTCCAIYGTWINPPRILSLFLVM